MTLATYLENLDSEHLYIIGPLFSGPMPTTSSIVFVDRGADFRTDNEGYSVGDGDSASVLLDEKLSAEKDLSDLAYVFSHIPKRIRRITLLGFLGGRRDHELMNLAEAQTLLKNSSDLTLEFDDQIRAFAAGSRDFTHQGLFSLFAFEKVHLSLSGACKYPVQKSFAALSSQGLSNEGLGQIHLSCDAPVFLFLLG